MFVLGFVALCCLFIFCSVCYVCVNVSVDVNAIVNVPWVCGGLFALSCSGPAWHPTAALRSAAVWADATGSFLSGRLQQFAVRRAPRLGAGDGSPQSDSAGMRR